MKYEFISQMIADNEKGTVSALYLSDGKKEEYICVVLEEAHKDVKVDGETRIPQGLYHVRKYTQGKIATAYKAKYGYPCMFILESKPGTGVVEGEGKRFEGILPHIGNFIEEDAVGKKRDDSRGCPLLNIGFAKGPNGFFYGINSAAAFSIFHTKCLALIDAGHEVYWRVFRV